MPDTPLPESTDEYLNERYEHRGETYSLTGHILEYPNGRVERRIEATWLAVGTTERVIERVVEVEHLEGPSDFFGHAFSEARPDPDPRTESVQRRAVVGAIEEFIEMGLRRRVLNQRVAPRWTRSS